MRRRAFVTILASGDTTAPTVTITSSESSPSFANPIPLTFTLSEASTDFAVGDITIGAGGSIGNFAGSGTSYTADLTVTSAGATITVDVAADSFHDAAGNGNTAATQFSIISALHLFDQFTTAQAAPLTTPRTCEPGPGTVSVVDTGNQASISGGALVVLDNTASGNPAITGGSAITRAAGLGAFWRIRQNANFSRLQAHVNTGSGGWILGGLDTIRPDPVDTADAFSDTNYHSLVSVARSAGYFYVLDGTLIYVSIAGTPNFQPVASANTTTGGWSMDTMKVGALGSPWNTDTGIATNVVASPGVGETTTQAADALVEMTWTAVTGQTWNLMVRRTDDDNAWYIRCDEAGDTIKLIERNAGVETERSSVAQTFNNGTNYRVVVVQFGNTIKTYVNNTAKNSYTSASFQNTATGVKTDRAGSNLIAWPRTLSGGALTELNKLANP